MKTVKTLAEEIHGIYDWRSQDCCGCPVGDSKEIKALLSDFVKEIETEVIKPGIEHGTLPDPNPYGTTVSVKRHNQVMREVEDIQSAKLQQILKDQKEEV